MPTKLTPAEINQIAANYFVLEEHRAGFPILLARLFKVSRLQVEGLVKDMIPTGKTTYKTLVDRCSKSASGKDFLPLALASNNLVINRATQDLALMALSHFGPSSPVCLVCGDIALTIDGPVTECPSCAKPITWEPPSVYHRNWVTCQDVVRNDHFYAGVPLGVHIDLELEKLNGLHPDVEAALVRHDTALSTLLEGLFSEARRTGQTVAAIKIFQSVSRKHFGEYQYSPEELDLAVQAGIKSQTDEPAPAPSAKKRPFGANRKMSVASETVPYSPSSHDTGSATVVVLHSSAESDRLSAFELSMHLLPLLKAHRIGLWDCHHAEFPNRDIQEKIEKAALIVCLSSTYFFNEALTGGGVVEQAVDLMDRWHLDEKIFAIRSQHYTTPTEGLFSRIVAVPSRPLSNLNNRDDEWIRIVEQIREKLNLSRAETRLESGMIHPNLQGELLKKFEFLSDSQFGRILARLGHSKFVYSPSWRQNAEKVIKRCVEEGTFINLRLAIEAETRL